MAQVAANELTQVILDTVIWVWFWYLDILMRLDTTYLEGSNNYLLVICGTYGLTTVCYFLLKYCMFFLVTSTTLTVLSLLEVLDIFNMVVTLVRSLSCFMYTSFVNFLTVCGMDKLYLAEYILLFWLFFLISILVSFLFYLFLGLKGFITLSIISVLPLWSLSTYLFDWFIIDNNSILFYIGDFNVIGMENKQSFRLSINRLTFGFGYLTLSIGFFVLLYSFFYFRGEPTAERLSFLLMLFVNSMLLLLFSDNLVVMFMGWEMIGVTSFFLINYWGTRVDTLKSAKKAIVFNLFSDAVLFSALVLIGCTFHTLDIPVLNSSAKNTIGSTVAIGFLKIPYLTVSSILMLLAAAIKSAQFLFHAWLPDSMEAPAPASALIHSATLVSAGIFLLTRMNDFWSGVCLPLPGITIYIKDVIIFWGALTAAYGGLVSSRQSDLKKILAYSTISHCGYMMVLVGCGSVNSLLFYFYIHGLYKALLFLITGNIMRCYQNQDFRKMGNAWSLLPFETTICIFSFCHLSGAPFSLGYVAKHSVITLSPHSGVYGTIVASLIIIGACSSVFYSLEFIRCVFFEPSKSSKMISQTLTDDNQFSKFNNPTGNIGLLVLGSYYVYASFLGYYLSIYLIDFSSITTQLDPYDYTTNLANSKTLPIYGYSTLSIPIITCYSIAISLFFYISGSNKVESNYPQLLPWLVYIILFLHMFTVTYNIVIDPIVSVESMMCLALGDDFIITLNNILQDNFNDIVYDMNMDLILDTIFYKNLD